MALTAHENAVTFRRIENAAAALQGLREEFARLKEFAAVHGGDLVDVDAHTVADLVNFRDNLINPLLAFMEAGAVAQRDRAADLQEWLTTPQV